MYSLCMCMRVIMCTCMKNLYEHFFAYNSWHDFGGTAKVHHPPLKYNTGNKCKKLLVETTRADCNQLLNQCDVHKTSIGIASVLVLVKLSTTIATTTIAARVNKECNEYVDTNNHIITISHLDF